MVDFGRYTELMSDEMRVVHSDPEIYQDSYIFPVFQPLRCPGFLRTGRTPFHRTTIGDSASRRNTCGAALPSTAATHTSSTAV